MHFQYQNIYQVNINAESYTTYTSTLCKEPTTYKTKQTEKQYNDMHNYY